MRATPPGKAERQPGQRAPAHALPQDEPGDQDHEERRGRGEEGGVRDRRVEDREVPEEEVAREGEPGEERSATVKDAGAVRGGAFASSNRIQA